MLFITVVGLLGAFEVVNLLRVNKTLFKTILGYSWIPEIILSIGLPCLAAATGTISGVVIAATTGFFITLTLEVCKRIVGTRKLKKVNGKRQWVETGGQSFASFVRGFGTSMFNKVKQFATDVAKPASTA